MTNRPAQKAMRFKWRVHIIQGKIQYINKIKTIFYND